MTIIDFLENNAQKYKDEECLVEINPQKKPDHYRTWREFSLVEPGLAKEYRRSITWNEFNELANKTANLLLSKGIKKGDKVAILLMNCLEWLPIYFGVLKTGALAVPMNYRYTSEEIKYCLDLADCNCLIFGDEFIGRVEPIADHTPKVKTLIFVGQSEVPFADIYNDIIDLYSTNKPNIELTENDEAAIYFSSGTTGFPKAILHLHKALVGSCKTEQNHHKQTHEDTFLCMPPLYHTGAKMHWFGSLLVGGRAVLLKGIKPEWIFETISEERCTIVWLLVPWAQDILDSIDRGDIKLENYKLDQWRLMHIGAQPVPPSLVQRWLKVFPHHQYDTNYGLSESIGPGCVHLGVENVSHVGAIGVPGYLWEVKIMNGNKEITSPDEVGELVVKGPGVMVEYYKNPEATAEILKDGWLYTGDMAKRDKDGFIYLVDRKKDVIITGGENIYPVQIEDFLRKHDKIKDVAVIGLPDKRLGEITAAIIEFKEGMSATEDEINEFCFDLPRYKRPKKIIFAKVPRNATGKIEKPKLRQIYCGKSLVEMQTTE
ncbi:MAG: acyl--CoA ligase [Acholeplasmatales bacterium]|nr:acyl--CoA ligase [Acholeplasmatales bacterium]